MHRVAINITFNRSIVTTFKCGDSSSNKLSKVRILQLVNHPCIISLEDVFDRPNCLFTVLELPECGELFDKIIEKTKLKEAEAQLHFFQIALEIKYIHFKKICHRDLKVWNMLLCLLEELLPIVKIKGIGLSKLVDKTRLSRRSTTMPLRGFASLSAQTQVSCLTCPQWHTGFFNVPPLTPGMCLVWEV